MADATKRTVTTVRHEYVLPSPTYVGEMRKAIKWALSDKADGGPEDTFDDALTVEARDDEVVIWWEEDR